MCVYPGIFRAISRKQIDVPHNVYYNKIYEHKWKYIHVYKNFITTLYFNINVVLILCEIIVFINEWTDIFSVS